MFSGPCFPGLVKGFLQRGFAGLDFTQARPGCGLDRPAFGPYLQLMGADRAYEPSALAVITFLITWGCMGVIQMLGRGRRGISATAY